MTLAIHPRRAPLRAGALALALLLAACGSDDRAGPAAAAGAGTPERPRAAAPTGDASAEEVAEEKRGDVDCPADKPAAPAGAPVQDVLGVRPGLSYEQAAQIVMCADPLLVVTEEKFRGFDFPTYGQTVRQAFTAQFAEARVRKSSQQIMREIEQAAIARGGNAASEGMPAGQSRWFVSTMGMPGEEKVIAVAREERFEADRNPTVDSVTQALLAKYGPASRQLGNATARHLTWIYDPRGRLAGETSAIYDRCNGLRDPDGAVNLSPDCGVVIEADVQGLRDNPALADRLNVGVVDQANGYAAITATEQGLAAMDAQRRADQVKQASKNAQAPSL